MSIWIAALALFGAVSAAVPAYPAAQVQATAKKMEVSSPENDLLDKLIKFHELEEVQSYTATDVEIFVDELRSLGIPPQSAWLTKTVMMRAQNPKAFIKGIKKFVAPRFDLKTGQTILDWHNSPLGRKVNALEEKSLQPEETQERKVYMNILESFPPAESKLKIAEKLEDNWDLTGYTIDLLIPIIKLWLPHRDKFLDVRTTELIKRFKEDMRDTIREDVINSIIFVYRDLSDQEFTDFADFSGTREGKWYRDVFWKGVTVSFASQMIQTRGELEALLTRIESEEEGLDLLKENFPPGGRYIALRKRDPFMPLVTNDGVIQEELLSRKEPVQEFKKERGKLIDMPLIPLEIYNKIEKEDPNMLADLKYYAELFNDEAELKSMDEEEYNETVATYRGLLLQAKSMGENIIRTDLQVAYDKLKFVGMISKKDMRIALIETEGRKGHSAKAGTLMGPNLGVVEVVREDRIIVIERYRDYLGEVLANKQNIEFSTPQQQG